MSVLAKIRDVLHALPVPVSGRGRHADVDADALVARVEALDRFLRAAGGRVDEERLAPVRELLDRVGERLGLSGDHTVVALAGATGGGKSSLFNTLARLELSGVGRLRPTTAVAHACVWNPPVPQPAVPEAAVPEPAVPELAVPEPAVPELAVPESAAPGSAVSTEDAAESESGEDAPEAADTPETVESDGGEPQGAGSGGDEPGSVEAGGGEAVPEKGLEPEGDREAEAVGGNGAGQNGTPRGLLDWLGIERRRQFTRESALDGEDEAALRGLVLLDLPDFDSVADSHRLEVDRLLGLVDVVIWVLDPQKYADRVVHDRYLRRFAAYGDVTVVVLNQVDTVPAAERDRIVADLRRLVAADGLVDVPVYPTSVLTGDGVAELRKLLEEAVRARRATLARLAADAHVIAEGLRDLVGAEVAEDAVDRGTVRALADALAAAAGVPAVTSAVERAYRYRAAGRLGWPLARWLRRLRPDPLRRLGLDRGGEVIPARTSLPAPTPAQQAALDLAVRTVGDRATDGLPDPWPAAVRRAARSRMADLPDALDRAVGTTDLDADRQPVWWRVVGVVQWLIMFGALVGLVWLLGAYALRLLGLPGSTVPEVGVVPVPTLLLLACLLAGALLAALVRPVVGIAARRAANRAGTRLRAAMTEVARDHVVAPIRAELHAYADARAALHS